MQNIRNFSIIAHIDHGKSTLADRLIQECGMISDRDMKPQVMDNMDIEQERGITIKAQSVRLIYKKDNQDYILNLIDTPGHVDFSYEVSRSLASCEGALLVVDATQGVQAQTIANVYTAIDNNLDIIPVINKIDLPSANYEKVCDDIEQTIGIDASSALKVSAKSGIGIKNLLNCIVDDIKPPKGDTKTPLKAIIYDSWFDNYLGVLALIRVIDGNIKQGASIITMRNNKKFEVLSLMYPHPIKHIKTDNVYCGEIAIVELGIKDIKDLAIGDTITDFKNPAKSPIEGFEQVNPCVFAGIYPIDTDRFEELREALNKLQLNDSSLSFEPESSVALGFGFRIGFLGLLHMEVIKERLEREFNIDLIATAPTVTYEIGLSNDEVIFIKNPSEFPSENKISYIKEPYVKATMLLPSEFLGAVFKLLNSKRAIQEKMEYISENRIMLIYFIPTNEIVIDFYDKLKSCTKGYASFDYENADYKEGKLVKLDVKVAGEIVDALSIIVSREKAIEKGKALVSSMKEIIPRQLFEVAIQASIGNKIISRESVKSVGKNVTAKCYGGDITRKRKLLEKQKAGKKRMKAIGKVDLPQEAFLSILKID